MRRKNNTTYVYASVFGRESWLDLNKPVAWFRATDTQSRNLNNKYSIVTQTRTARKWWHKPNFDSENPNRFVKYSEPARLNQNVVEIKRLKIEFGPGEIEKHL